MALYSDLVGAISQAAYFARLMARHVVNGVPTDTWLSVVNTGLSTTQYASEVFAELRSLITGIFRSRYLDEWQGLIDSAVDAADLAAIEARIEIEARNVYGIERQAARPGIHKASASGQACHGSRKGPNRTRPRLRCLCRPSQSQGRERPARNHPRRI